MSTASWDLGSCLAALTVFAVAANNPENDSVVSAEDQESFDTAFDADSVPAEEIRQRNARLQAQYVQALGRLAIAKAADDADGIAAADAERERIGSEFIKLNWGLVNASARPFLKGNHREDHLAAAMMGLWEAFVGTASELANTVNFDDDGNPYANSGWNPDASTFGTWSRSHISGRAARSVATWDEKFHGMTYSSFQKAPAVQSARAALREELGREPSLSEIATKAGMTSSTVSTILAGAPVSLSTPVFDDDGATMGDVLADSVSASHSGTGEIPSLALVADELSVVDLCVAALRLGLTGREPLTVSRTAVAVGVGRGVVNNTNGRVARAVASRA